MSTIQTNVPVPHVTRLAAIESEINILRGKQTELLGAIMADCEFMEVPVLQLLEFEIEGKSPAPGDRCHVVLMEEEATGRDRRRAHLASECDDWMCSLSERTKYPKYAHVGRRYWATPEVDHVVIGRESFIDEAMWGKRHMIRYTFAPVSQSRSTAQRILEHA